MEHPDGVEDAEVAPPRRFGPHHIIAAQARDTVRELKRKFAIYDRNFDGSLDFEEFRALLLAGNKGLTPEEMTLLFEHADADHDGRISFDEFVDDLYGRTSKAMERASAVFRDALELGLTTQAGVKRILGSVEKGRFDLLDLWAEKVHEGQEEARFRSGEFTYEEVEAGRALERGTFFCRQEEHLGPPGAFHEVTLELLANGKGELFARGFFNTKSKKMEMHFSAYVRTGHDDGAGKTRLALKVEEGQIEGGPDLYILSISGKVGHRILTNIGPRLPMTGNCKLVEVA